MAKDFTRTNNPSYLYMAELMHPFPEWIASKPVPEPDEFEKMASTAFADPARRLLPVSSPEAAFYSAINIFAHLGDYGDDVFDRVKSACAFYGIEEDVAPYATIFADEHEKSASGPEEVPGRFAIDEELDGVRYRLLPLNDAEEVRQSARDLSKMAREDRIHFLMLVPAAREICKAAADSGVADLPGIVTRFGLDRFDDVDAAKPMLDKRASFGKMPEAASLYESVREEWAAGSIDPYEAMEKIAAIDDAAGVPCALSLTSDHPTPYEVVFCGGKVVDAEKMASENVLLRGVLIPVKDAKAVNPLDIAFRLSKSAAADWERMRDVADARDISLSLGTWAEADQKTFLRLVAEA